MGEVNLEHIRAHGTRDPVPLHPLQHLDTVAAQGGATARLRERSLFAKTISIKIKFADFSSLTRSKTVPIAIDNTHDTYEVVKALYLALRNDGARIRLVGVSLSQLQEGAPVQLELGARERGWREADTAIDRAQARFGRGSVRPGRLIRPEGGNDEE